MKKILPVSLAALFILLAAATAIYQKMNPPLPIPKSGYTEKKATLLLYDYEREASINETTSPADTAVETEKQPEPTEIYALMLEMPMYDIAEKLDAVAAFMFFDYYGSCSHMYSNDTGYYKVNNDLLVPVAKAAVTDAYTYYDNTFTLAKKMDFDVPQQDENKVYIVTNTGVYYKIYTQNEAAALPLFNSYLSALEALENINENTEGK